jgi:WD40 repeat protein
MVKSSFSPDGRFVVSGSEDGCNLIFSSLNGQGLQEGIWGSKMFDTPLVEISWSPTAHIIALAAYGLYFCCYY